MRVVVHWFRSVMILSGLCALPSGEAAPSLAPEAGSTSRPALVLVSVGGTVAGTAAISTSTGMRGANFIEASAPVSLGSLRHGARDPAAAAPRTEAMPAGFGAGKLQHIEPAEGSHAPVDANSMLAMMLAALGVAALAAARAPASPTPSVESMQHEPARR